MRLHAHLPRDRQYLRFNHADAERQCGTPDKAWMVHKLSFACIAQLHGQNLAISAILLDLGVVAPFKYMITFSIVRSQCCC